MVAFDASGHCRNGAYFDTTVGYAPGALASGDDGAVQLAGTQVTASAAALPTGAQPRTYEFWLNADISCCGDFGFQPLLDDGGFRIGAIHGSSTEYLRVQNEANNAVMGPRCGRNSPAMRRKGTGVSASVPGSASVGGGTVAEVIHVCLPIRRGSLT